MTTKFVYVGDEFYDQSGSMMGSVYTEKGFHRSDWGKVQIAAAKGKVEIRPATKAEKGKLALELMKLKLKR